MHIIFHIAQREVGKGAEQKRYPRAGANVGQHPHAHLFVLDLLTHPSDRPSRLIVAYPLLVLPSDVEDQLQISPKQRKERVLQGSGGVAPPAVIGIPPLKKKPDPAARWMGGLGSRHF